MKMTWKDEHGASLVAENPDESVKGIYLNKIKDALIYEWQEFMQEVCVAMRKLKPGESIVLESKPVKVTLEKPMEEPQPTPDDYLKRESWTRTMTTKKTKALYEIRRQVDQEDPVFDEVVAHRPGFVHIEQMDKGHWWIGIDVGQGKRIMVNFTARGAIKGTAFLD